MALDDTSPWQVWVDTGGTFTDCLARGPDGTLHRAKVLSSSALRGVVEEQIGPARLRVRTAWDAPADFVRGFRFHLLSEDRDPVTISGYDPDARVLELGAPLRQKALFGAAFEVRSDEEAPVLAARLVTRTPAGAPLPPVAMRLATTRGTNALLERRGVPVALFVTEGFGDLLEIGTQQRPDLFALDIRKPPPLHQAVVEVPERIAADGRVLRPLDTERLAADIGRLLASGVTAAAVALLHSDRHPEHERRLAQLLRQAGFAHVSCSSDLAPFIKILPRAQTAVVNAYLAPIIDRYVEGVRAALARTSTLHVMTSVGGLVRAGAFQAKDSLLSGPAGGIVGAALAGRRSGFARVIAFDMGGTSTDVARYDGDFEYVFEHQVGAAHLVAPALAIESVAAGGGSVCTFDRQGLRVGPESAGADPGPACYGAGGPLTVTDVNLLLGRLSPDRFPIPISPRHAEARVEALLAAIARETGARLEREALLEGFLDVANERMADAIRAVSLRRGYDPSEYALVTFGGAGGQHACAVAARLGITTVLVPREAGLLSALGIGHALVERFAARQVLTPLADVVAKLAQWFDELAAEAARAVRAEGVAASGVTVRRRIVNLRFVGQESVLPVEFGPDAALEDAFRAQYESRFGHRPEEKAVEVESLRVVASSRPEAEAETPPLPDRSEAVPARQARSRFGGAWHAAAVHERAHLSPGAVVGGPALIFEAHSATAVEPGWEAFLDGAGALVLTGAPLRPEGAGGAHAPEVVELELFTNRFRAIAGEMGEQLRRNSFSTNVKERLDFSCALLDADGELVVNAPHIPVHLGALGLCVRRVREALPLEPGDVVVTNHPGFGGSHLPDVTVITPAHTPAGELLGYVASRAHHAEIGGTRPGSMPPDASTLAEEGVVIAPMYLSRAGEARWDDLRRVLTVAPYPSRSIEDNLADLRAAVAANRRGAEALVQLATAHGAETVRRYMGALKAHARRLLQGALARHGAGRHAATERLDDGSPLCVTIDISADHATIDFAGSAGVHGGNLNATPAIVHGAVLYVLRLLVREPLPLNEGLLRAVTLRIPPGMLNPPFPQDASLCPAVVGGNVETSQRLVDTLLGALKLAACSQGTMNNVLWGTNRFGYYETVCGGAGAGPGFDGARAVHTHMTNTRITDPEIVEHRYPVRVERFAVRGGSGGAGQYQGGDGVVREYVFLAPMSLSLLTQHRAAGPYGLAGGGPGQTGAQRLVRAGGDVLALGSVDGCDVQPGDRLILETPGGGGWGPAIDSGRPG